MTRDDALKIASGGDAPPHLRRMAWTVLMHARSRRVCGINLCILQKAHEHGLAAYGWGLAPAREAARTTPEDAA